MDIKKLIILAICLTQSIFINARIWYVSQNGRGNKDGTSWSNAAADICDIIKKDYSYPLYPLPGDEIWVSQGTYSPIILWKGNDTIQYNPLRFRNTFRNKIRIYGGFSGYENSLEERNKWNIYKTIISGDNQNNCIWIEGSSYLQHGEIGIIIDGFTLSNGHGQGSAIRLIQNNTLFNNIVITGNNEAPLVYVENAKMDTVAEYYSKPIIVNTLIYNNQIYSDSQNQYSIFQTIYSDIEILNTTIVNNFISNNSYTLLAQNNSIIDVYNTIMYNNSHGRDHINNSRINYQSSLIQNILTNPLQMSGNNLGHNLDQYPSFVDESNNDYRITLYGPCYLAGDLLLYGHIFLIFRINPPIFFSYDIEGKNRFYNGRIDIGAYACITPNQNVSSNLSSFEDSADVDFVLVYDLNGKLFLSSPFSLFSTDTLEKNKYWIVVYYKDNKVVDIVKIFT